MNKQALSNWLDVKGVPYEVAGKTLVFYPLRSATWMAARETLTGLAQALSGLMHRDTDESGYQEKTISRGQAGSNSSVTEREILNIPLGVEMSKHFADRRNANVAKLVDLTCSETGLAFLSRLVMDSLRDDFQRDQQGKRFSDQMVSDFLDSVDMPTLVELLKGVWEANKHLFPFGKALESKARAKVSEILAVSLQPTSDGSSPTASEPDSVKTPS